MATKMIVIGEESVEKKLTSTVFVKCLDPYSDCIINALNTPSAFTHVELISLGYTEDGLDLMFAHSGNRNIGMLYLGKWNDGVN